MAEEKIFANGFSFKRRENAPDFVIGNQSIKVDDAISFLNKHQKNGWVNLDVKQAKNGNYYLELDTWEASGTGRATAPAGAPAYQHAPTSTTGDLPF